MKTLYTVLLTLLILFLTNEIAAQITIDGTITDSELNPINNVLVEIIDEDDTTNQYSATTNESGYFTISNITEISNRKSNLPSNYIFLSNYPNPFNPSTIIYYELPKSENIEIKIYDILGREIRTLFNSFHKAGTYTMSWDGRNDWNSPVAAGIYFCRLKTKDQFKVHKMVLLDGGSPTTLKTSTRMLEQKKQEIILNTIFNYNVRVSRADILLTEFNYLSCSGDTTLTFIAPKILQTAIIGPEGGKLETEDFSLTVPEGSFDENSEIKVFKGSSNIPHDENRITDVYSIQGLPKIVNHELTVKLKLTHQSVNDYYVINIRNQFLPEIEDLRMMCNWRDCEIESGFIKFKLDSFSLNKFHLYKNNLSLPLDILFYAVDDYVIYKGIGSQVFFFNSGGANEKVNLLNKYIDEALEYFEESNLLTLDLFNNTSERIRILVLENGKLGSEFKFFAPKNANQLENLNPLTFLDQFNYFIKRYVINLPRHILMSSNDNNIRMLAAECAYRFIRALYLGEEKNWFDFATISWMTQNFSIEKEEWNSNFFGKPLLLQPFLGMEFGQSVYGSVNFIKHGYGMSSLIHHLMKNYNGENDFLEKVYREIIISKSAIPAEFLINSVEEPEYIWWPNFFKEYIQGNVYNVPSEEFFNNITETIEINDGDTLKYVDETYNDLSAKLFQININSEDIKNNKSLNFKISPESLNLDYVKALMFGISENNLSFISEGIDFSVGNLYKYEGLIACVVNSGNEPPYTGTSNIELDIRVTDELQFDNCKIKVRLLLAPDATTSYWDPWWYTKGTFRDNVYTGIINTDLQGGNATGSVQIVLDDYHNIVSLEVMAYNSDQYGSSQWGMTASSIQPTRDDQYVLQYKYYGTGVCSYVTSKYAKTTDSNGNSYESTEYGCDENALLEIDFNSW